MTAIPAAVFGAGRLGSLHARILAENPAFELRGVGDTDLARATEVAGRHGARASDDPAAFLDDVRAVVVAVPTAAHHETAARALDAGCHVLVEKPLARTLDEADDLIARAEAAGLVLGVGHVERFNGVLLAAEAWLDRPRFIESLRLAPFQPRGTDVTVVLDLMIHDIDLVLALADSPIASIHAVGVPVITPWIDIANARLVFESGTVANITASRVSTRPTRQLRLFQASGYFSLDLGKGEGEHLRRIGAGSPADPVVAPAAPGGTDAAGGHGLSAGGIEGLVERIPLNTLDGEPLRRELDAFAAAIRGDASPLVPGRAGRDALEVAIRITREIEGFAHVVAQDS